MHDPRLGRFFAVDPLTKEYPHYTPYSFSGNKLIAWMELEGLEETEAISVENPLRTNSKQTFGDGFQNGFASNFDMGNLEVFKGTYLPTPKAILDANPFGFLNPWNISETLTNPSTEFENASGSYTAGFVSEKFIEIALIHKVSSKASKPNPKPSISSKVKNVPKTSFNTLSKSGKINPNSVKFPQASISSEFKGGGSVSNLTKALKSGKVNANDVSPIRIVEYENQIFTLDNRRLKAFKDAGIEVRYIKLDKIPENEMYKFKDYKAGKTNGSDVKIRGNNN